MLRSRTFCHRPPPVATRARNSTPGFVRELCGKARRLYSGRPDSTSAPPPLNRHAIRRTLKATLGRYVVIVSAMFVSACAGLDAPPTKGEILVGLALVWLGLHALWRQVDKIGKTLENVQAESWASPARSRRSPRSWTASSPTWRRSDLLWTAMMANRCDLRYRPTPVGTIAKALPLPKIGG